MKKEQSPVQIKLLTENEANAATAKAVWEIAESGYAESSPWTVEQFHQTLAAPNALFLVAVLPTEELAGVLIASQTMVEADIYLLVVAQEYQQQGIGQKLFEELIKQAKKKQLEAIFLEVRASNEPAYQLYRKLGFQEVGRRKNYYAHPTEDALMMKLDIVGTNRKERHVC